VSVSLYPGENICFAACLNRLTQQDHNMMSTSQAPSQSFNGDGLTVGMFDSGLGGLSVLSAIRAHLPLSDIVYVADSGFAPYGEKSDSFIEDRSRFITSFLLTRQADVVVVACNTATAAAVHHLRQKWAHVPIIGVEPGVKPAVAHSRNRRVGVLATPSTLRSKKFQALIDNHAQDAYVVLQACAGLAKEIELGELDSPRLRDLVETFSAPLRAAEVDTAVLGCTHYPFVQNLFKQALGNAVEIVDTADAVARHTTRIGERLVTMRLPEQHKTTRGLTELWSSADPAHLAKVARSWLGLDCPAHPLPEA